MSIRLGRRKKRCTRSVTRVWNAVIDPDQLFEAANVQRGLVARADSPHGDAPKQFDGLSDIAAFEPLQRGARQHVGARRGRRRDADVDASDVNRARLAIRCPASAQRPALPPARS
jgi:hypothetical protein